MLAKMKVGVGISLGLLVIGLISLALIGVAQVNEDRDTGRLRAVASVRFPAAPEFDGIARGHGPVATYVSGQTVFGLSDAVLKPLGEEIEQGLKLVESAGRVMMFVAALGLVGLVVVGVGVVVARAVTAPPAGTVSLAKRVAQGDPRGTPRVPDEVIMRGAAETPRGFEQILSFTSAGTEFGVPIVKVREIVQCQSVTEVPGAPDLVRGVAKVRGTVVPVLDLGTKLRRGVAETTTRSCILVVDVSPAGEPLTLGVFADTVNEIVDLPAGDVAATAVFGGGAERSYLVGLGKLGKRVLLLVDVDRMLTASEAKLAAEVARLSAPRAGVRGVRSLM